MRRVDEFYLNQMSEDNRNRKEAVFCVLVLNIAKLIKQTPKIALLNSVLQLELGVDKRSLVLCSKFVCHCETNVVRCLVASHLGRVEALVDSNCPVLVKFVGSARFDSPVLSKFKG